MWGNLLKLTHIVVLDICWVLGHLGDWIIVFVGFIVGLDVREDEDADVDPVPPRSQP